MTYTQIISGYCPLIESDREIRITVSEFSVIGSNASQKRITEFQCPDGATCPYCKGRQCCDLVDKHPL